MAKKVSRTRRAYINTIFGLLYELVAIVCGLILPRLILATFGSSYNGLTSSISQFISIIALLKAGIGGVSRAALYKPLAEKDTETMSQIVVATEKYLRKVAMIFLIFIFVLAAIYPLFISNEFSWGFASSLVLIISITTFGQYYFGLTYQNFLMADQKQYIVSIVEIVTLIVNTIVATVLIRLGAGIHLVKLGSAMVFILQPIILRTYTIKKYNINLQAEPHEGLLKQKWDAIGHAIANFINSNTDIMVLTVFTALTEVSVYTVYNYVIANLRKVINTFVTGFGAAFGDMYARNQTELMNENLGIYEVIVFSLTSIAFSVTAVLICPFAVIYTHGVKDVQYYRPLFAGIMTMAGAFMCYRIPYQTIIYSIGHYKQTRNGAFAEAIINITVSVVCVIKLGLVGVAIGTLVASAFRSFQYAFYLSQNVLRRKKSIFVGHVCISVLEIGTIYTISKLFVINNGIGSWLLNAFLFTMIAILMTVGLDFIFYKNETVLALEKMKKMFGNKKVQQ